MQLSEIITADRLNDLTYRLGSLFTRSKTRQRAMGYTKELLSGCEQKNSCQLVEWLGDVSSDGVQYLLD